MVEVVLVSIYFNTVCLFCLFLIIHQTQNLIIHNDIHNDEFTVRWSESLSFSMYLKQTLNKWIYFSLSSLESTGDCWCPTIRIKTRAMVILQQVKTHTHTHTPFQLHIVHCYTLLQKVCMIWTAGWVSRAKLCTFDEHTMDMCNQWHQTEMRVKHMKQSIWSTKLELLAQRDWHASWPHVKLLSCLTQTFTTVTTYTVWHKIMREERTTSEATVFPLYLLFL